MTNLLDLVEVVLRVLIQDELANWSQRELFVRPHLGEIEDIVSPVLSLLRCHGLLFRGLDGGKWGRSPEVRHLRRRRSMRGSSWTRWH